jgi:acyl-coenzyme A synthetase/AMP-(fatty) acid ligase
VDFIAVLPRNPSGKVLRRELRAPYWEGRDRAV